MSINIAHLLFSRLLRRVQAHGRLDIVTYGTSHDNEPFDDASPARSVVPKVTENQMICQ